MKAALSPTSERRRRRSVMPITFRRALYEWTAIILLLSACAVGIVAFGAVRNWSSGSLMVLVFAGLLFCFARPLLNTECRDLRIPPGGLLFALFALYAAILIPFAAIPYEAKIEWLKIASYVGAFWAWTELASRYGRWRIILWVVLLLATLVALYALVQHARGSDAVLNLRRDGYGMRASGTFMAPAHMGAYMAMMIPMALALMLMPSAGAFLRLFSGYGLVLFLPVLLLTGSRSAWVGTMMGIPVVLLLLASRRSWRRVVVTFCAFVVIAAAVLGALYFTSPMFNERVEEAIKIEGTAAWRLVAWSDTWEMIKDAPVFGHGPGSYRWLYPPYQTWDGFRWLRYAHNEYLHLWAEYGLVGLLLMGAFLGCVFFRLLRYFVKADGGRDAYLMAGFMGSLVASLGHAIFDFNFHVFALMHVLVLFGGVTMSGLFRLDMLRPRRLAGWQCALFSGAGCVFAMAGLFMAFQVGVSGAWVRLAEDKVEQANIFSQAPYTEALSNLERAARLDPGNWLAWSGQADIYRRRAFWIRDADYKREMTDQAYALYREAFQRNPHDMNVVYGIARCYYLNDDLETSLTYLRRAVEHWPNNIIYSKQLGLQLRELGRLQEALDAFEQANAAGGWDDPVVRTNLQLLRRQVQSVPQ